MSREDFIAVAVRLFALFLVVTAIRHAAGLATFSRYEEISTTLWATTAAILSLTLAFAAALWHFPLTIARKLLPSLRDAGKPMSSRGRQAQDTAFIVLGVWVLATALPDASYWVVLATASSGIDSHALLPENTANIVATVLQLIIGFALVLGASGLSRLLYRLRYGNGASDQPEA